MTSRREWFASKLNEQADALERKLEQRIGEAT